MASNNRLILAFCFLWTFFSLPISVYLADTEFETHIFLEIFSLFLVLSPMWISLGWRWVTNTTIPKEVFLALAAIVIFLVFKVSKEVIYIPLLCYFVLIVFDVAMNGVLRPLIHSLFAALQFWISKISTIKIVLMFLSVLLFFSFLVIIIKKIYTAHLNQPPISTMNHSEPTDLISTTATETISLGFPPYSLEDQKSSIDIVDVSLKYDTMTSLQRELYLQNLTNSLVSGYGLVRQVSLNHNQSNVSNVTLYLKYQTERGHYHNMNIFFEMLTEDAIKLIQDNSVIFHGKVTKITDFGGKLSFYLYDVSITQ